MSKQQILEKAIDKASANGWKPEAVGHVTIIPAGWLQYDHYKAIIFNHDFAKSLWGEKDFEEVVGFQELYDGTDENGEAMFDEDNVYRTLPKWQYHLQMMVVADDPIKYLGANI